MYALLTFPDGIYHVCKSKDVVKYEDTFIGKYKGKRYICNILAQHENYDVLNSIKRSLINEVPKVLLQHISIHTDKNKQNVNETRDNDATTVIDDTSHILDNARYVQNENFAAKNSQKSTILTTETNCQTATCDVQEDAQNSNQGINENECNIVSNVTEGENVTTVRNDVGHVLKNLKNSMKTIENFLMQESTILATEMNEDVQNSHQGVNENECNATENISIVTNNIVTNNMLNNIENIENFLIQDSTMLATKTNSQITTCNRNIENSYYDIEKILSECSSSWNWNGNTLEVYETDINNTLQRETVEGLNMESSVDCVSTRECVHDDSNTQPSSDHFDSIASCTPNNLFDKSITQNKTSSSQNVDSNKSSGLDLSTSLIETNKCPPDDAAMFVLSTEVRMKKHFCMYCNTFQTKIARHLEHVHKNELEVQKFIHLPKGCRERKKILETIRRRGDFNFNVNSNLNDGELLVERRSKKKYNRLPSDYTACPKCKAFILKITRRHHSRNCISQRNKDTRAVSVLGRTVIGRIHQDANNVLRLRVFPILKEDHIIRLIRYDELIIAFGNQQCEKYKASEHNDAMIRQKIRRVGRLFEVLKSKHSEIVEFASIYYPRYSTSCIEAINKLAGLSLCGKFYKTPSLASALGGLIKELGKILINRCIRQEKYDKKVFVEDFLKVFLEDFATLVSKTIYETINQNKRRKQIILPVKSDIAKLHNFLQENRRVAYNSLKEEFSYDTWLMLMKVTLISVQVFNRRRAGEIQRAFIEDYKAYQGINNQSNDMYETLSTNAKEIAKRYVRFTLRGKLGRSVPVLLTAELRDCIDMILKHRKAAKVSSKNPYLFGLPTLIKNKNRYLLACDLLRQYSIDCGAEKPETLRATELRKHVATMCINYNLSENEISTLANFMGHADKIHFSHYRQSVLEKEILEVSQYLEAAQGVGIDSENESDSDSTSSEFNKDDTELNKNKNLVGPLKKTHNDINNELISSDMIQNLQQNTLQDSSNLRVSSDTNYSKDSTVSDCDVENDCDAENNQNIANVDKQYKRKQKPGTKSNNLMLQRNHTRWTELEKRIVLDAFGYYLERDDMKLPTFEQIGTLIKKHPNILKGRNMATIKTWLHNQKRKNKKIS